MSEAPSDQAEQALTRLIQARLDELFEARDEDRPRYTDAEVARELTKRGYTMTRAGISSLRRAERINPKATTLRALADFFNVSVGYLLGEDEATETSPEGRRMYRSFEKIKSPGARRSFVRMVEEFLLAQEDDHGSASSTGG